MSSLGTFRTSIAIRALASVMALALILFTVGCSQSGASRPNTVKIDFERMPNGPSPAMFGGSRANSSFTPDADQGARFRIESGRLVATPTQPGRAASYFSTGDLGGPVTSIGAKWSFTENGGTPSALVLLVTGRYLRPPYPLHLVVTPTMWTIAVWPPDGEGDDRITLHREIFATPLKQDGTTYQIQVSISGDRAEVELPSGERRFVRDERIAEWAGNIAVFGAFSDDGATGDRVAMSRLWATGA